MQSKRLFVFIIACFLYLVIFSTVQNLLFPPKPMPPGPTALTPGQKDRLPASLLGGMATDAVLEDILNKPPKPELSYGQKNDLKMGLLGSGSGRLARNYRPEKPRPELITLGSDKKGSPYFMQVVLDPKGASVRKVVLNQFFAATERGLPTEKPLELIPDTIYGVEAQPSYVLYHYDPTEFKGESPLNALENTVWETVKDESDEKGHTVVFTAEVLGVKITRMYRLAAGDYHLSHEIQLERAEDAPSGPVKFRYQLAGAHGLPIEGRWYTDTFRQALIGYEEEGKFRRDLQDTRRLRYKSVAFTKEKRQNPLYAAAAVQYFTSAIVVDDQQEKRDFLARVSPTLEARVIRVKLDRPLIPGQRTVTFTDPEDKENPEITLHLDHFQPEAIYPPGSQLGMLCRYDDNGRLQVLKILPPAETQPLWYDDLMVRVASDEVELKEGDKPVVHKYLLYNGPVKVRLLRRYGVRDELVDRYLDNLRLDTLTDYQSPGPMGSFANSIFLTDLIIFFTNLLHTLLGWLYKIIPVYGICIILLTVIVRGLMFPLSRKQALTSIKMQELAPEMKKLNEQYKEDPRKKTEAMMALYRKHGVNPLGSCWMLLLQLPIFMGLYWAFRESVQFRLAGFLWVDNLAAPDMLFPWSDSIPVISRPEDYGSILYLGPYFNLLPLLAIAFMIIQQRMFMPPPTDDQQVAQRKMMTFMMILFAVFFYKVAAGLCVYFIASSLWGFAERKLLPKKDGDGSGGKPAKSSDPIIKKGSESKAASDKKGKRDRTKPKAQKTGKETAKPQEGNWISKKVKGIKDWWAELLDKARKK